MYRFLFVLITGWPSGFDESFNHYHWGIWGISSNGRAPASHAGGKEIDAPILHSFCPRGNQSVLLGLVLIPANDFLLLVTGEVFVV